MLKNRHVHNLKEDNILNSYIILSAGCGVRKKYTEPESMIKIGKNRLIDYQIDAIRKFDKNSFIFLVVGFFSDSVIDYVQSRYDSVKIIENVNFEDMTSAGSLKLAINLITDTNLYVLHGNRYFSKEAFCVNDTLSPTIFVNSVKKNGYNIGVLHQNGIVKRLSYGLKTEWSELFFVPKKYLKEVQKSVRESKSYEDIYKLMNIVVENTVFKVQENKKGKVIDVVASKGVL